MVGDIGRLPCCSERLSRRMKWAAFTSPRFAPIRKRLQLFALGLYRKLVAHSDDMRIRRQLLTMLAKAGLKPE